MTDEKPIKATLKAGAGYDAPWLTVDMPDPSTGANMLTAIRESALLTELVATAEVLKGLNKAAHGATPVADAPAEKPKSGWGNSSTPAQEPAVKFHPEGKQCACGKTLQYKKVFSKAKNKEYEFWSCPDQRNKDDGHLSEFV